MSLFSTPNRRPAEPVPTTLSEATILEPQGHLAARSGERRDDAFGDARQNRPFRLSPRDVKLRAARPALILTSAFRVAQLSGDSDVAVLDLQGELGDGIARRTFAMLQTQLSVHLHLLLCLRRLRQIDTDGLSGLLSLCEQASQEDCELELFGPLCPQVHRALGIIRLNGLVQPRLTDYPA